MKRAVMAVIGGNAARITSRITAGSAGRIG
jgi:hypothetical protein